MSFNIMQRCPLESIILHAKQLDLGEPREILSLALQPPNLADIERTILSLKEVATVDLCIIVVPLFHFLSLSLQSLLTYL